MSYSLPLTNAVQSGDEQAVSAILANGADVNETTGGGQTALILAVIFGHTNLVKLLMNAGADPQLRDNLGLNALEWAQRRGLTEAAAILTNRHRQNTPPRKIVIPLEEPPPQKTAAKEPPPLPPKRANEEEKEGVSEAEKSLRWIAGFKQRLHEQELRRLNRNEPPPEPPPPAIIETPKAPEPEPPPEQPPPEPPRSVTPPPRILIPAPTPEKSSSRKRCPQCNAIYNSDLVSYCAHHIVPLVPADDPIISEPPKSNVPLFWILLIITLAGSVVLGSLITTYIYRSRQAAERVAAEQVKPPLQKGTAEVGGDLVGKAVSLPDAECPVKGPEPVTGTVTVRVMVDKNGQVYWARGAGGDWLMRGAATEAAMKSTFSPEKLRNRETEGTITYIFKP